MLSKSSIFLKLMGTFYEQIGSTEFMRSFDIAYSSVLLSRYSDIISNITLLNGISNIFSSVRFGYLDPLEINVGTREIVVRDVYSNIVSDVDFLSLSFHNADVAYLVIKENGFTFIDVDTLVEISNKDYAGSIPIVFGTSGVPSMAISEWLIANDMISSEIVSSLMPVALESLSRYALYRDSSKKTIDIISNVLLGAVYAKNWETVLRIKDNTVFTDKTEYIIEGDNIGRVCVNIGDELDPYSLITRISSLSTDVRLIGDIQNIYSYMSANGLPLSNLTYLYRLSEAIAQRKIIIDIPSDVITPEKVDILSVIAGAIGITSSAETIVNSFMRDDSMVEIVNVEGFITIDESIVDAISSGRWILDIPNQGINIDVIATEKVIILNNKERAQMSSALGYRNALIEHIDEVIPSENSLHIIEDIISADANNSNSSEGVYVETVIAGTSESNAVLVVDGETGSVGELTDGVQDTEIKEATITIDDAFNASESASNSLLYRSLVTMMLNDHIESVISYIDMSNLEDFGYFSTSLEVSDVIEPGIKEEILFAEPIVVIVTEVLDIENKETGEVNMIETISGEADINIEDSFSGTDNMSHTSKINDNVFIADASNIESDVVIDS